jgi:hypothetical protein
MSINNTNGLVGRYVTDWSGPAAVLVRLATRLGVPNFSGGTLVLTGRVKAKQDDTVTVAVTGTNSIGVHTSSEVTLRLPTSAAQQQPEVAE